LQIARSASRENNRTRAGTRALTCRKRAGTTESGSACGADRWACRWTGTEICRHRQRLPLSLALLGSAGAPTNTGRWYFLFRLGAHRRPTASTASARPTTPPPRTRCPAGHVMALPSHARGRSFAFYIKKIKCDLGA
jgi:hypothetical protein